MTDDVDDYSPEKIEYYLEHWDELQSAAEGGTGSLSGGGSGRGDRLALASLLADLERAADELPPHWTGTLEVFRLQARWRRPVALARPVEEISVHTAIAHMARRLGWSET